MSLMKIFCSGIGGIGLSAYASLMRKAGHEVFGSDRAESPLIEDLRSQGITVVLDQSGTAIPDGTDLFVYSEAIPDDAPERVAARAKNIREISYPHAVGELSKGKKLIAICGSHGKSSTTAMVARLLIDAGLDPTVVVGTKLRELDGRNWRQGNSEWFVLEACEYRRSFLYYEPSFILLTNADVDHLDYYKSQEDYRDAFVEFTKKLSTDGVVITHMSDEESAAIATASGHETMDADNEPMISLKTPGVHMQHNAQLALSLAKKLDIPADKATEILGGFAGTWRRMEEKGVILDDVLVIDDYGHHPVEIRATLEALSEAHSHRRLVCVFQPHTHDRTIKLYDDFIESFASADVVVIPNVYDARHQIETAAVDVPKFVQDIAEASGVQAIDGKSLKETEDMLGRDILQTHDLLVIMGAGDVTKLATSLVA